MASKPNAGILRRAAQRYELDFFELGFWAAMGLNKENCPRGSYHAGSVPRQYVIVRDRAIEARALAQQKIQDAPEEEKFSKPFTPEKRQNILLTPYGRH